MTTNEIARALQAEIQRRADGSPYTHVDGVMQDAASELRRLAAEVERLRADAERYRWLRNTEKLAWPDVYIANACHRAALSGNVSLVDAAIDAAMTGEGAP